MARLTSYNVVTSHSIRFSHVVESQILLGTLEEEAGKGLGMFEEDANPAEIIYINHRSCDEAVIHKVEVVPYTFRKSINIYIR